MDLLFRRRKQKSCDTKLLEKSPSHLFPKLLQDTGCHQIEITMVLAAIKGVGLPCGQIKVQIYIYLMLQTKTKRKNAGFCNIVDNIVHTVQVFYAMIIDRHDPMPVYESNKMGHH